MREILRTTSARHRGQRKIGISMRAGISIREVARELEEDIELDSRPPGAEGDLKAYAHGPCSCTRRPRPPRQSSHRRRRYPWTPPSPSPAPGSFLPTRVAAHLCAWPLSRSADFCAHRCELRGRAPPLLQHTPPPVNGQQLGPTSHANGSILGPTNRGQRLSSGSHMSASLTETARVTE